MGQIQYLKFRILLIVGGIFTVAVFISVFLCDRGSGIYSGPLHADISFLDSRVTVFSEWVFSYLLRLDLTHLAVNPAGFGAASLIPGSDRTPPENSRVFGDAFAKISLI